MYTALNTMQNVPTHIIEKYIRHIRMYGNRVYLGHSEALGYYTFDSEDGTLIWSEQYS